MAGEQFKKKHGHARPEESPTYRTWRSMRNRCLRPKEKAYAQYGAVGITVCERWAISFENFLADMGVRHEGTSLDRIDNSKGYEPSNCRWATTGEQARNKTSARLITHNGETMCAEDWATRVGIAQDTLLKRLDRGWDAERALSTPPMPNGKGARQVGKHAREHGRRSPNAR